MSLGTRKSLIDSDIDYDTEEEEELSPKKVIIGKHRAKRLSDLSTIVDPDYPDNIDSYRQNIFDVYPGEGSVDTWKSIIPEKEINFELDSGKKLNFLADKLNQCL